MKKTLQEIQKRLNEIAVEVDKDDADVDALNKESEELIKERNALAKEEIKNRALPDEVFRSAVPSAKESQKRELVDDDDDKTNSLAYRKAFMNFVTRGTPIPADLQVRAAEITTTTDASAVVPTTIMNEIVKEMKQFGDIWARVRKLNVQGGISFPILTLKPSATWIGETTPSEDKKIKADSSVTFSYYGLECKIAQTLLASVVTLSIFQELFVQIATEAIIIALEKSIISGSGLNQPLGITKDSRVPTANVITLSATEIANWADWKKKVFAKMKKAYRSGEFIMAQATFDGYIDGMADSNKQPIGRVNYGIDGAETYRFGGKNILTVEEDLLPAYEEAAAGDVFAIFANLSDYAVNSNLQLSVEKWKDPDTNQVKNKAILICDGKLVDPYGVLLIKKATV